MTASVFLSQGNIRGITPTAWEALKEPGRQWKLKKYSFKSKENFPNDDEY